MCKKQLDFGVETDSSLYFDHQQSQIGPSEQNRLFLLQKSRDKYFGIT